MRFYIEQNVDKIHLLKNMTNVYFKIVYRKIVKSTAHIFIERNRVAFFFQVKR